MSRVDAVAGDLVVEIKTPPLFEIRGGELCGAGCGRPFSYVAARIRKYCRAELAVVTPLERRVLERLISEYPTGKFWQGRNGELVESVCRAAARYVRDLDNWTEAELAAATDEARAAGLLS